MNNLEVKEEGAAMEASKWMHITEMKARKGFKTTAAWRKAKMALWAGSRCAPKLFAPVAKPSGQLYTQ